MRINFKVLRRIQLHSNQLQQICITNRFILLSIGCRVSRAHGNNYGMLDYDTDIIEH